MKWATRVYFKAGMVLWVVALLIIGVYANKQEEGTMFMQATEGTFKHEMEAKGYLPLEEQDEELYERMQEAEKEDAEKLQELVEEIAKEDCRITQAEHDHVKEGRGSVYAIDVKCGKRGVPADAYFPQEKPEYVIEAIGEDRILGNYVVIRHGNLKWVYGHVVTSRGVGTYVKVTDTNNVLGQENWSGVMTNYHTHIEKWQCEEGGTFTNGGCVNVSSLGEINAKSMKVLDQRGWRTQLTGYEKYNISQKAANFIAQWEGLRLTAYKDVNRWAIGYGSPSYYGETITAGEARIRLERVTDSLVEQISTRMPGLTEDQYVALVSLAYNCHSGIKKVYEHGIDVHKQGICTLPGTIYENGLKKRRVAEARLLFN